AGVPSELCPGRATIRALEDAAAGATADQDPRLAPRLPEGRVERPRIRGVHDEVDDPRRVVAKEDLVPRLAAIRGLVDAALGIGGPDMPERSHVYDVGIVRIDTHARDLARLREADVRPRLPAISGLVYAIAMRHVAADVVLASAHIHDVGIRLAHADGAHRAAEVLVARRGPVDAAVGRLEHATARRAKPIFEWSSARPGHGH